ncbi:MAG TPA: hypothetical protein PKY96_12570 [Flavobacteriales bacterium]|nr:hypothetical protein [Flavobacteriales bacterium]
MAGRNHRRSAFGHWHSPIHAKHMFVRSMDLGYGTPAGETITEIATLDKKKNPSVQPEAHVFFSLSSVHICAPSHDGLTITDHHRGPHASESINA